MRNKIYDSPNVRQKAYRKRKKDAGYRRVVIDVPEHVYAFIKGRPSELVEMFIKSGMQKGLFIDFDQIFLLETGEAGARFVELRNKEGDCLKVTDPEKIKVIDKVKKSKAQKKVRVYPDGSFEVI